VSAGLEIYDSKVYKSYSGIYSMVIIVESIVKLTEYGKVIEKPIRYAVEEACLAEYNENSGFY